MPAIDIGRRRPVPGDPGVPIGAAWLIAHMAGAPRGAPLSHAFYCGLPPSNTDIAAALKSVESSGRDVVSIGDGIAVLFERPFQVGDQVLCTRNDYPNRIRNGTVAIGDRLPSVAELAKQEGTSGTTVQRAAAFLAEVGAIRIDRNVGIFAAVPYCIDLIGGPYAETDAAVVKAFRPKTAIRK